MSLDLYIESKTPIYHRGTGVYIRVNGETKELKTKQEVLTYFPDANPDEIKETSYVDNEYFHMNIIHNLTEMADQCEVTGTCSTHKDTVSLYDLLWHPEENLGITALTKEYLNDVTKCFLKLTSTPELFEKYNPDNGWGTYDQLVEKTKQYIIALLKIHTDFENYTLITST